MVRGIFWGICVSASAFAFSGCQIWLSPLPSTAENLRVAVATVSLKANAGAKARVSYDEAREMVQGTSAYWNQKCGISLVHWKHFEKDAQKLALDLNVSDDAMIEKIKDQFADQNYLTVVFADEIRHEPGGDLVGGNANYPGWGGNEAILMGGAYFLIFAHELGHFWGLGHEDEDFWNLMYPGDYGAFDRPLRPDQCEDVRDYLLSHPDMRELCRPDSVEFKKYCVELKL